jgi:hypothetical protein
MDMPVILATRHQRSAERGSRRRAEGRIAAQASKETVPPPAGGAVLQHRRQNVPLRAQGAERSSITHLDHHQGITVIHNITCRDDDFRHRAGHVGEHRDFHLHRLQDHHRILRRYLLPHLDFDLHHGRDEFGDDGMAHAAIVGFVGDRFR